MTMTNQGMEKIQTDQTRQESISQSILCSTINIRCWTGMNQGKTTANIGYYNTTIDIHSKLLVARNSFNKKQQRIQVQVQQHGNHCHHAMLCQP